MLLRRSLTRSSLLLGVAISSAAGCARDIDYNPPDPNGPKAVVAQFDPTNPIPVLQIVPSPTALAQNADGTINQPQVAPENCEYPNTAQCLAFVNNWPATTPLTLYFSGELDPASISAGVKIFRRTATGLEAVDYNVVATNVPVQAPNAACQMGADADTTEADDEVNGSAILEMRDGVLVNAAREMSYRPEHVPTSYQTILLPTGGFRPASTFIAMVVSNDETGLRDINGKKVGASGLFSLMNDPLSPLPLDETPPAPGTIPENLQAVGPACPGMKDQEVEAQISATFPELNRALDPQGYFIALESICQGQPHYPIQAGLLRSQVIGAAIQQLAREAEPGRSFTPTELADAAAALSERLTDEQRQRLQLKVFQTATRLRGLYRFVNSVMFGLQATGNLEDRRDAILVNAWTTGPAFGSLEFDPLASKLPFPNVQLLTRTSTANPGALQVNVPITAADSPTSAALKRGLNTLDGFSTTAPMVVTATADIDPASLVDRVVMYPVNAQGVISGDRVAIAVTTSTRSATSPATITIRPLRPLPSNQNFVVAILTGVTDTNGQRIVAPTIYDLLKIPVDFSSQAPAHPAVVRQLQCSTVATTGMLADDQTVAGSAALFEQQLQHQRWLEAFSALESANPPIPRTGVLMAWNYKTQSINELVDLVNTQLLPGVWEPGAAGPRLVPVPGADIRGSENIAGFFRVSQTYCVPLCLAGEVGLPPEQCLDAMGNPSQALLDGQVCRFVRNIVTGGLDRATLYLMRTYRATVGSPYTAGTFTPGTIARPELVNVPIWVIRPAGTSTNTPVPVAVFQHGLGSVKEAGVYLANSMAQARSAAVPNGYATIMMDLPFHGQRASDVTRRNAQGVEIPCTDANGVPNINPNEVTCDLATGACTGGCDGVRDSSGTGFLSTNVFGARDNFRQSTIDQLVLLRTIQQQATPNGLFADLDATRMGYVGQSLGAITGANLLAYVGEGVLDAAVLNVGGGSLTTILLNTVPAISAGLYAGLAAAGVCEFNNPMNPAAGCKDTPAFRQFLLTAQWALDPGDPLATSVAVNQRFPRDKILMQMSLPDPVVTNLATYALAGPGYGFNLMGGDERLQVWDFSAYPVPPGGSGCHAFLISPLSFNNNVPFVCGDCPYDALCNTLGAQVQAGTFLVSDGATIGEQRVPSVGGAVNCANACQ